MDKLMNSLYRQKSAGAGAVLIIISASFLFYAYSSGITGTTLLNSNGCQCHAPEPSQNVTVVISGPDSLVKNESGTYTVTISGGPLVRGGTNIAASAGLLTAGDGLVKAGNELTHTLPKAPSGGIVTFTFQYTAPASGDSVTLYANGNSVNFNGSNVGDQWNFAQNKTVIIKNDAVPVELNSFVADVDENNILLKWKTATEINNSGFELQRSDNDSEWNNIAFIKGNGSTTEPRSYLYRDNDMPPGRYNYRLKQVDYDGSYSIYNIEAAIEIKIVNSFALLQNFPNPFNPATNFKFRIPEDGPVSLKIYDGVGNEVSTLINEVKSAGEYNLNFDGSRIASGVYYYTLSSKNFTSTKKMILIK